MNQFSNPNLIVHLVPSFLKSRFIRCFLKFQGKAVKLQYQMGDNMKRYNCNLLKI